MTEDELIARWIVPNPPGLGSADACLVDYGVAVWALAGYFAAGEDFSGIRSDIEDCITQAAADYDLPREAVEAALAYYRRNKRLIDARLLLNVDDLAS
jgi:uncharacterized protein (DUF433 family)